jgi:hypothetical protein
MNYELIRILPMLFMSGLVVVTSIRVLLGRVSFHSLAVLMVLSMILVGIWGYLTMDEQVFMNNISIIADVFKHRLETITHVELILLVILGAILFKKVS